MHKNGWKQTKIDENDRKQTKMDENRYHIGQIKIKMNKYGRSQKAFNGCKETTISYKHARVKQLIIAMKKCRLIFK